MIRVKALVWGSWLALATAAPGCWVILGNDKDYLETNNACNNADDVMQLMDANVAKVVAQDCGKTCSTEPNISLCGKNCMITAFNLSDACGTCWGDSILCGVKVCAQPCLMSPMACDTCTMQNCELAFHQCAGP